MNEPSTLFRRASRLNCAPTPCRTSWAWGCAALLCLATASAQQPPRLDIATLPNAAVELRWSETSEGFLLESRPVLSGNGAWETNSAPPTLRAGRFRVARPVNEPARFFRLRGIDAPRLDLRAVTDGLIELSWPVGELPFLLQSAPVGGEAPQFVTVAAVPRREGGREIVTVPTPAGPTLYRLAVAQRPRFGVAVERDTGLSARDAVTADLDLRGVLASGVPVASVRFGFDGLAPELFADVTAELSGGEFLLPLARLDALNGTPLPDGPHVLRVQARNETGEVIGATEVSFVLDRTGPKAALDPVPGAQGVLPRQLIVANFDEPVQIGEDSPAGFVTKLEGVLTVSIGGTPLPGRLVLDVTGTRLSFVPEGELPGATELTVRFDGERVRDRAGNAYLEPPLRATFRTAGNAALAGTAISGQVFDSQRGSGGQNVPVVGAAVSVAGAPQIVTVTDATGRFLLTNAPAGRVLIDVNGRAAAAPAGRFYPTVAEMLEVVPGRTNALAGAVYLPLARTADFVTVNNAANAMTEVMNPAALPGWMLEVPGGAAQRRDGSMVERLQIAPVPPDRLPAPLPPGMDPGLVITIQAEGGAEIFSRPMPLTAPNLEGLPPGAQTVLWDFDHAKGEFVPVATATVSADGQFVTTDPGQGVLRPGWHFFRNLFRVTLRATGFGPFAKDNLDVGATANCVFRLTLSTATLVTDVTQFIPPLSAVSSGVNVVADNVRQAIDSNPNTRAGAVAGAASSSTVNGAQEIAGSLNEAAALIHNDSARLRAGDNVNTARYNEALQKAGNTIGGAGKLLGGLAKLANISQLARDFQGQVDRWKTDVDCLKQQLKDPPGDAIDLALRAMQEAEDAVAAVDLDLARAVAANFFDGAGDFIEAYDAVDDLPPDQILDGATRTLVRNKAVSAKTFFDRAEEQFQEVMTQIETAEAALERLQQTALSAANGRLVGRFEPAGGAPRTVSGLGEITLEAPPGTRGTLTVVDVATLAIGQREIVFPASTSETGGSFEFELPPLTLFASRAPDANGNSLPDDLDAVLGAPSRAQAELLRAGLPLDASGLALQGILARHPVGYEDIALLDGLLVGISTNATADVLDLSQPFAPVLVARMAAPALPGISSSRDRPRVFARGRRVVLTGVGTMVYDLSNPRQPLLLFSDQGAVPGATIANGVLGPRHVVVESAGSLRSYDLATGQIAATLALPGAGTVTDLAMLDDVIFLRRFEFFSAELTLVSVRLGANGQLTFLDSLQPFNIRQGDIGSVSGLAVDRRALYVASFMSQLVPPNPGFATFDITDPANLRLLANPSTTTSSGAARLATDGAGHLYFTVLDQQNDAVEAFDVSNRADTGRRLLTQPVGAVQNAIAAGNNLVAFTGPDGTTLARLLPSDAGATPPVINAFTAEAEGGVLTEGARVNVRLVATDDAAIARVDLFLQGDNRVATSVTWPFALDFAVPADLPDNQPLTLTARVTDAGGNVTTNTIALTYRARAPRVLATTLPIGVTTNLNLTGGSVTFDSPMERTNVNAAALTLRSGGADGALGTGDDTALPLEFALDATGARLLLGFGGGLPPDRYRLTLAAGAFRDRGGVALDGEFSGGFPTGNGAAGGDFILEFSVQADRRLAPDAFPMRFFPTENGTNSVRTATATVLADVNGDGRDDLLLGQAEGAAREGWLYVTQQNGDGTFGEPRRFAAGTHPALVLTGDFNGDGRTDAAVLNFDENATSGGAPDFIPNRVPFSYAILLGNGDGTFQSARMLASGRQMPRRGAALAGDFNGDGRTDLAQVVPDSLTATAFFDAELLLFRGNADGSFAPVLATPVSVGNPQGRSAGPERDGPIAAADLNRDGRLDLVVDGFRIIAPGLVLLGRGDGTFATQTNTLFEADTTRLLLGDFTGDGAPDALYGDQILRGNGDGAFTVLPNDTLRTNGVANFDSFPGLLRDFTGDGRADFAAVVPVNFTPAFRLFRAEAGGAFTPVSHAALPSQTLLAGVSDVNGDGALDVFATVRGEGVPSDSFSLPNGVAVLFGQPGGGVAGAVPVPENGLGNIPDTVGQPFTADFNGDGRLDFFAPVFNNAQGQLMLTRSRPDGSYAAPVLVKVTDDATFFVASRGVADFNGDGRADLVISDDAGMFSGASRTFLLLNAGDGSFVAARPLTGVANVWAAGDFTGDGKADLLSATGGAARTLALRPGNGDGTFGPAASISVGTTSLPVIEVLPADVNRDGRPDLLVRVNNAGIFLLLNNGGGGFSLSDTTAGGLPANQFFQPMLGVGDWDGDGLPDLALKDTRDSFAVKTIIVPLTAEARFAAPLPAVTLPGNFTTTYRLADVNGDGLADVVAGVGRGSEVSTVQVLLNNGDGTLQSPASFVGTRFGPVAAQDFNGDGAVDLLAGSSLLLQRR